MRGSRGRWGRPLCSHNARPGKALVGRAQLRPTPPSPLKLPNPLGGKWKKRDAVTGLFARVTRGRRRVSRERPDLPSCSQNAHDKAVLVRCAQLKPATAPLQKASRSLGSEGGKGTVGPSSLLAQRAVVGGPRRGKDASWRVQGGRVTRSRRRARSPHPSSEF